MAEQKQDDQLEHTNSSYVRIQDVALKTGQRRWTIGRSGERGSGISVLTARHDDDDDDIFVYNFSNTLSGGKTYLVAPGVVAPGVVVLPWAIETVLSPLGWRLIRAGYRTYFHTLYDEKIRKYACVCLCFPLDKAWHKVNDPKANYRGDLGEGKVENEPRLEPCWSLLLIDPLSASLA